MSRPATASLTKQQRTILDAIHFFLRKGEIPTVREVGALVGLRSPATVFKHLRALEKKKYISLNGKSRGIRLLRRPLLPSEVPDSDAPDSRFTEKDLEGAGRYPGKDLRKDAGRQTSRSAERGARGAGKHGGKRRGKPGKLSGRSGLNISEILRIPAVGRPSNG